MTAQSQFLAGVSELVRQAELRLRAELAPRAGQITATSPLEVRLHGDTVDVAVELVNADLVLTLGDTVKVSRLGSRLLVEQVVEVPS